MDKIKPYSNVDEYLDLQTKEAKLRLDRLRTIIRKAVPVAEEVISYGMPGYRHEGLLAWFAASKNHYALYVPPRVMQPFLPRLKDYSLTKSAIHFPYNHDVPEDLINDLLHYALELNQEKKRIQKAGKTGKGSDRL